MAYIRYSEEMKFARQLATIGVIILIAIITLFTSITNVPANHVGIKVSKLSGVSNKTMDVGLHFKTPFIDKVYKMPTTVQTVTIDKVTTQTKDGQFLNTAIDTKYKVSKSNAMNIFKNYTTVDNLNNTAINPAVQRAIESVTGEYDVFEILGSKRTEVYERIDDAIQKAFDKIDLELMAFTITDQDAGADIEKAIQEESIKQKQVDSAKQEQEKAKIEAETKKINAQADADAQIIKAEGEAEANKKLNDSLSENIIKMKEAEARLKHGWVEVQTGGDVITNR